MSKPLTTDALREAIVRVKALVSHAGRYSNGLVIPAADELLAVCDAAERCAEVEAALAIEYEQHEACIVECEQSRATLAGIERLLRAGFALDCFPTALRFDVHNRVTGAHFTGPTLAAAVQAALAELDKPAPPQHCCGAQGFGLRYGDACPVCEEDRQ